MPAQTVQEVKRILRLDVEYEKAIQRLGEYKAKIEEINKQMKDLKKQIASGSMSPRDVKSAQTQMAALDTQVRVLKKDEQELMKTTQNTIKVHREEENSLRGLRAQLSNLTKEFDSLSEKARNGREGMLKMMQINEVTAKIKDAEAATQRFYRNVGNYQSAIQGINQLKAGFVNLGSTISGVLGGLGLGAFTNNMISAARDFEDSIARVRAVANPLLGDFQRMRDTALELGRTTRYTSGEVAKGMEELARKGLNAQQVIDSITPTLRLAQANMVSIADAAQISSSAMRAFGMDSKDLAYINDQLSTACANSASTLNLLGEAMKTAGPVANVANVSLSETTAMISTLANVGMTGSDAGTGIKQIILALSTANRSKKGLEVLKKYNIELNEARLRSEGLIPILKEMKEKGLGASVTDLKELTGKYASPRIANLIQNIDTAEKLNEKLKLGVGENDRMFEQSLGDLSKSIYAVQSAWQNMMIELSADTNGFIIGPLDALTSGIRFLAENIGLVSSAFVSMLTAVTFGPLINGIITASKSTKNSIFKDLLETRQTLRKNVASATAEYKAAKEQEVLAHRLATEKELELERVTAEERRILRERDFLQAKIFTQQRLYGHTIGLERELELEEQYTQQLTQLEQQRVRIHQEAEEAKTLATQTANNARVAGMQKASAEEALLANKNIGLWTKTKVALGGVATAFKNVWRTIKGFAWVFLFTEVIQLTYKWYERLTRVSERLSELEVELEKINSGQTDAVKRIEAYQKRIEELQKIQNKTAKQQIEYNKLLQTAWGMVSKEAKKHNDIIKALRAQIELIKEKQRVQAHLDLINEQNEQALKTGKKAGIEGVNITTPGGIIETLDKMFDDYRREALQVENYQGNSMAKDAARKKIQKASELLGRLAQEIGYKDAKVSFVIDPKTKAFKSVNENYTAGDIKKAKETLNEIRGLFPLSRIQFGKTGEIFDNIEIVLGSLMSISEQQSVEDYFTNLGDFKESHDWSGRGGKGREFDPLAYLQNLLKKYNTEFNKLVADTTFDVISKQKKEIENSLQSLKEDVYKIIGGGGYAPVPQWKRAAAKYPKLAAQVTEMMNAAIKQATLKANQQLDQIYYTENERRYKIEKDGWDARIALAKSKLAEWVLITKDNVISETEKTLKLQEESFNAETQSLAQAHNKQLDNLEKAFVTSGRTVKQGDRNTVLQGYEEYLKRREEIEKMRTTGDIGDEEYSDLLRALDKNYKAEAEYYRDLSLLEARYEQDSHNRQIEFQKKQQQTLYNGLKKQNDIIIQGMQNQLASLQMGYDEQTNANHDYYTKAKFGEDEYWKEIVWMVGERQAEEFRLQYEAAKKEYDFIEEHGKQMWETEEEYEKRRIDAKKKMVDIETKVNSQIFSNQQAVIQSTNAMVGSFGELASAMIEDEKEKAEAMKAFTLMQAMLQLALSIANIAEKASHKGAFGIPEAIAGIAEITSIFATVFSTINSANANGYAGGGKVHGPGTETSDSIPAKLSDGEFVMTAKATKLFEPLLMAMNGIGAGVALPRNNYVQTQQSADLTDAFARAAQEITPVVDVREVTRVQNRVKTIQNLGSYKL